ncbi:MAG: HIRAN domain-containing protein [Prevotella sp.]|nr:HIRAN domain-containing protein [Prevotella sp.]
MAKTRKRNYQYFYKSKDSGNVWPYIHYNPNRYIDFVVRGTRYCEGLVDYVGEFKGRLMPEPENESDQNAIRVEHEDGHRIGYVPKEKTQEIRDFKVELPCECYCLVERRKDDWGDVCFFAICYVSEYPVDE